MLRRVEQLELNSPDVIRFGRGTVTETAEYVGDGTVLVVTDPGIVDAGLLDGIKSSFEESGVSYQIFTGVEPDPRVSNATHCVSAARDADAEMLVGVGGGSSMDVTKAASLLLTNGGSVADLFGRHNVPKDGLPMVLVPTTAGTGSEVSPGLVLFDDRTEGSGEKEVIIDLHAFADAAVVDPNLTMHLPSRITKATGLDAFAHAIGSYMSAKTNTFADALCIEAMNLIEKHLRDAAFHGSDAPEAREKMSMAATMGMIGRVNGGKAAIHSIAYGIQTLYDVPHGEAIAMVLPEVVEYNRPAATEAFARLGTRIYQADGSPIERADRVIKRVFRLRDDLGLDQRLTDLGATEDEFDELVDLATHSDRHLEPNPRPINHDDAAAILREVW